MTKRNVHDPRRDLSHWDELLPLERLALCPPNTARAYRAQGRRWAQWCHEEGIGPEETEHLRRYITYRFNAGRSWPSVTQAVAALDALYRSPERPAPFGPDRKEWLAALRRRAGVIAQEQPRPLDRAAYEAAREWSLQQADQVDPEARLAKGMVRRHLRTAAAMGMMRDALLRRSEAAAATWGDLEALPEGGGLLTVFRSKTLQQVAKWLSPQTMADLERLRPFTDTPDDDRILGVQRGRTLCEGIAEACAGAGLGAGFSGHSPRVGMAVDLAASGEGVVAIQQAGDWTRPDMPAYYCRGVLAGKGAVARFHAQAHEGA